MTQASMLHLQGERIDRDRISKALQLVQSTSPNYILLASLDAARQQMALQGKELITRTLHLAAEARDKISKIDGLSVLDLPKQATPGFRDLDRTRLTVNVTQLGLSGYEADEILHEQLGVTAELPLLKHLTFIISIGNTPKDIEKLIQAFTLLASSASSASSAPPTPYTLLPTPHTLHPYTPIPLHPTPCSPRDAFFSPTETIAIEQAIGRISAELICPYPPGIPVLIPGEAISSQAIDYLRQVVTLGARITGCSDPSLETLKVLK
jgi:arginine/lysine/ornithine decarboxylase